MAYATWTEVQKYLPPDSQKSEALENKAAELLAPEYRSINARLGERYVVPLTLADHPNAYAWATDLHAKFVAAKAMVAVRSLQGQEDGATWYPDRLLEEAEKDLQDAVEGRISLTDAVESSTEGGEFQAHDGYSDLTTTEQGYLEPWFTRHDTW